MTYFSNAEGQYVFELHQTKSNKGLRDIPLTKKAIIALKQQRFVKKTLLNGGKAPLNGYDDLVLQSRITDLQRSFL